MVLPVLKTKLHAPPPRPAGVPRSRLLERLDRGARGPLTLLSAPAGFGKTTLASAWLAARAHPAAWVSLDARDADPARFLEYLVAALQTIDPEVGRGALEALRSSRPPPAEAVLTDAINQLTALERDAVLVIDDLHAVGSAPLGALRYLLEHLPPRLHLIVTTREDPDLPLPRLRARGELTEIRAADLRFTPPEAAAFLGGTMGLAIGAAEVAELERRTEGWIAGLQLAAASLRGRDDPEAFVRAFAGEHRHVFDYLVDEVLRAQPPRLQRFLLDTSLLERLSGPLCDAVTGETGGAATLEGLERANLFLVPLDDRRRWFRYHDLFADVLRAELARAHPERVPRLHARASDWFAAHGATEDAIRHALAASDDGRAARLVERAWRAMDRAFRTPAWFRWARALPEAELRARPVLAVGAGWARLETGDFTAAAAWFDAAERRIAELEPVDEGGASVADPVAYAALPARIAAGRAYRAQALGDGAESERFARRALELATDDDPGSRGVPAGLLGLAHWARGELAEATEAMRVSQRTFRQLGDVAAALSPTFGIAETLAARGRLSEALEAYREALRYAAAQAIPNLPGLAELHVGLAELQLERAERDDAAQHLRTGQALEARAVLPGDEGRWSAEVARLELALGDPVAALERLDEADRAWVASPMPTLRPTDAIRARVWLAQGRTNDARAWVDAQPLDAPPSYTNEYVQLTAARVHLALYRDAGSADRLDAAVAGLERLLAEADAAGRARGATEALVLLALAHRAAGDDALALATLEQALERAEPEGRQAVFADEGPALADLLRRIAQKGATSATGRFARRLLAATEADGSRVGGSPTSGARASEVEPLTDRERDVLRFLPGELSGPQIARELGMSVHTLRSHTKTIYAKLGASGRRAAVRRARDLDLI